MSNTEDRGGHEDIKSHVKFENTFQLTATKKFPEAAIKSIIKDVLEGYLVDQTYEPDICRQMTKTLSEVSYSLLFNYYLFIYLKMFIWANNLMIKSVLKNIFKL